MKLKNSKRIKQFFICGVVPRFLCFFFGHNISKNKVCKKCNTQFGVPNMKNPPNPP